MPINVKCHKCGKAYRLKDDMAGRKFKCKDCESVVVATPIPESPSSTGRKVASASAPLKKKAQPKPASGGATGRATRSRSATPERASQSAKRSVSAGLTRPTTRAAAGKKKKAVVEPYAEEWPEDDYGDDYGDDLYGDSGQRFAAPPPRRKAKAAASSGKSRTKSKSSSGTGLSLSGVTFNLNRLNAILVFFGGMLCVMGCREMGLAGKAGAAPKPITLQELVDSGPGTDVYFTVSNMRPVNDGYVADENRSGRMTAVWYPCVPVDAGGGSSSFVVYSTKAPTEADVSALMMSTQHTGMLINSIQGLDKQTKKLLRENMPGVNVDTAHIFHVGRTPAGFVKYAGMILGGLVLAIAGLGWIFLIRA